LSRSQEAKSKDEPWTSLIDLCRGAFSTFRRHAVVPSSEVFPAPFQPFLADSQPLRTLVNSDCSMLPVLLQPSFLSHRDPAHSPLLVLCWQLLVSCFCETKLIPSSVLNTSQRVPAPRAVCASFARSAMNHELGRHNPCVCPLLCSPRSLCLWWVCIQLTIITQQRVLLLHSTRVCD
jgi:hypothetical protein